MALNVELDMSVEELSDINMTVDDIDEIEFGMNEVVIIGDHTKLANRDAEDQHPISAITGLEEALSQIPSLNDIIWDCGTASGVV